MACTYIYNNKSYTEDEILEHIELNIKEIGEKIDINRNDVQIYLHEFAHPLLQWLQQNNPEVFNAGIEVVKNNQSEAQPYIDRVNTLYPNLTKDSNAYWEEVMAEIVANNGVELIQSQKQNNIEKWLENLWNTVKNILGITNYTPEQVSKMTLREFANAVNAEMLNGEKLFNNQSELLGIATQYENFEDFVDHFSDFRDGHGAPSRDIEDKEIKMDTGGDFSLLEVAQGFHNQPDDYFNSKTGPRSYYYSDTSGMQSYTAINNVIRSLKAGRENNTITAYRAIPKDVNIDELKDYDWVSFSEKYTIDHGESRFGENGYKIIKQEVPIKDVWWDGNDIREWGYDTGGTKKYSRRELKEVWESSRTMGENISPQIEVQQNDFIPSQLYEELKKQPFFTENQALEAYKNIYSKQAQFWQDAELNC